MKVLVGTITTNSSSPRLVTGSGLLNASHGLSCLMLTIAVEYALSWPHFIDEKAETPRGKLTCLQEGIKLSKKAKMRTQPLGAGGQHHHRTVGLRKTLSSHAIDQHRTRAVSVFVPFQAFC